MRHLTIERRDLTSIKDSECDVCGRLSKQHAAQDGMQRAESVPAVNPQVPPGSQRVEAQQLLATPVSKGWKHQRPTDRRPDAIGGDGYL